MFAICTTACCQVRSTTNTSILACPSSKISPDDDCLAHHSRASILHSRAAAKFLTG